MGGHDHCCATGDEEDGVRLSFHKFPKDIEDKMLWVSRVSRKDLPCDRVSKTTVLCSRHFYNGKRTAAQPHSVKFEHKTYPLCRKVPLKRSNPEPVLSEAEPPAKKVAECHTVPSLSSLCTAALKKLHGTWLLGHISQRKPSVFTSHQWKHDNSKFSFCTGLPAYDILLYTMEYLQPHLSSLYKHHSPKEVEEKPPNKLGRHHSLTSVDEFHITLVFLRHGSKEEILADLFGLSNKSYLTSCRLGSHSWW